MEKEKTKRFDEMCTIYRTVDGFIVSVPPDTEEGTYSNVHFDVPYTSGYDKENRKKEMEGLKEMLYELCELMGCYWNKHHKYNLKIEIDEQERGEDVLKMDEGSV